MSSITSLQQMAMHVPGIIISIKIIGKNGSPIKKKKIPPKIPLKLSLGIKYFL